MATVELVVDAHNDLGESPIWDRLTNTIFWVDINGYSVHSYRPSDDSHQSYMITWSTLEPAATVCLTDVPGNILVPTKRDVLLVKYTDKDKHVVRSIATTPEEHGLVEMRFNDGKVSPQGTLILGRMHLKWRDGNHGRLYYLDPSSNAGLQTAIEDVWLPNGMDWKDGVMYFACSGAETITEYQTDENGVPKKDANGNLISRLVADMSSNHKYVPDGLTLDSDGNIWVAPGESGSVVQIDPKTGQVLQTVKLPVKRPTACTFGGPDLEHLYVTTRVETGDDASPHHGGLFKVTIPGVKGASAAHQFKLNEWMKNNDDDRKKN